MHEIWVQPCAREKTNSTSTSWWEHFNVFVMYPRCTADATQTNYSNHHCISNSFCHGPLENMYHESFTWPAKQHFEKTAFGHQPKNKNSIQDPVFVNHLWWVLLVNVHRGSGISSTFVCSLSPWMLCLSKNVSFGVVFPWICTRIPSALAKERLPKNTWQQVIGGQLLMNVFGLFFVSEDDWRYSGLLLNPYHPCMVYLPTSKCR